MASLKEADAKAKSIVIKLLLISYGGLEFCLKLKASVFFLFNYHKCCETLSAFDVSKVWN